MKKKSIKKKASGQMTKELFEKTDPRIRSIQLKGYNKEECEKAHHIVFNAEVTMVNSDNIPTLVQGFAYGFDDDDCDAMFFVSDNVLYRLL
jgi:hypothetical protein